MSDRARRGRRRRAYGGVAGIAGTAALLLAAAAAALAVGARARAGELVEDAGRILLRDARPGHAAAAQTLHVNGLQLRIRSGHAQRSVSDLLDGEGARCGLRGPVAATPRPLVETHRVLGPLLRALAPVLREESGDGGYLACLAGAAVHELAPDEIVRRLRTFAQHGDLAALGDLRFVWARREAGGTSYVALWSEGPLHLARAFPARGDAPGADLPGIPRPPGGRRVLSAFQDPRAPMLASYRVELPAPELADRYRRVLIASGSSVSAGRATPDAPWLLAAREGAFTLVAIARSGARQCVATLLPLQ